MPPPTQVDVPVSPSQQFQSTEGNLKHWLQTPSLHPLLDPDGRGRGFLYTNSPITTFEAGTPLNRNRVCGVSVRTSFTQPARDLLCFLGRRTWQQTEYFADAAPAGPVQNVCKSHTEWSIATEHVRNVVRQLRHNHTSDDKCHNVS